jgi:hypothetical protein
MLIDKLARESTLVAIMEWEATSSAKWASKSEKADWASDSRSRNPPCVLPAIVNSNAGGIDVVNPEHQVLATQRDCKAASESPRTSSTGLGISGPLAIRVYALVAVEEYRHRASTQSQTGHFTAKRVGGKLERALLKLASDVVFAHARLKRRPLEAESGGCAGRSANQPFGFL